MMRINRALRMFTINPARAAHKAIQASIPRSLFGVASLTDYGHSVGTSQ